jgi:hypothetical protein
LAPIYVETTSNQSVLHIPEEIIEHLIGRLWDRIIVRFSVVVFVFFHWLPPRSGLMHLRIHASTPATAVPIIDLKEKKGAETVSHTVFSTFWCSPLTWSKQKTLQE